MYRTPLLAWALLLAPVSALAAEPLPPVDRAYLSIGHYRSANDLTGRWDAADGSLGTRFGFQRDLGFDDAHQALHWNAGLAIGGERRHKLEFFGYGYDDTSQRSIERSLQIGDEVYPIHASLAGNLDVDIQGLSYTWFFLQGGRQAMGFGLGAVRYDLGLGLVASLQVQDESVTVRQRLREHAWAPLLRFEYVRSLSPHWRWGVAAAYVTKPGGEITGEAIDAQARLEWFPWKHAGLSLRYNHNSVDLDFRRRRYDGGLDLETRGLQLAMMLRF